MIGKVQDVMSAAIVVGVASGSGATGSSAADTQTLTQDRAQQAPANAIKAVDSANDTVAAYAEDKNQKAKNEQSQDDKPMDEQSVSLMTKELNELMSKINCNLEFKYNKEVNLLSVKMIDKKTKEVLKEFPPEEMIKNMIQAKDWLGAFLDKNA